MGTSVDEAIHRPEALFSTARECHEQSVALNTNWIAYHQRTMDSLALALESLREKQQREKEPANDGA